MNFRKQLALLAPLCLLAACAAPPPPPPPPIVAISPGTCAAALSLVGYPVVPVVMTKESGVTFDDTSSCMKFADGQPTFYSVFRLPDSPEPYLITIRSLPQGQGMIIPRLMLMAENSTVLRTVEGDSFTFHGSSMMTKLRSHPGETYLVVAVDNRYVGQQVAQVMESFVLSSSTSFGKFGAITTTSTNGDSHTHEYIFSFNGRIVVSAEPVPRG